MNDEQRELACHAVYSALGRLPASNEAVRGIAGIRLIMNEILGEERQRELVGTWNEERQGAVGNETIDYRALSSLAMDGTVFAFVSAGMPLEWAKRHTHLFQYMPPVHAPIEENACAEHRRTRWDAGEYAQARDAGNMLLALAVLAGDAHAIYEHAKVNLRILEAWRAEEPDLGHDYEFEEHAWLRDHAEEMARWGRMVRQHLDMVTR